MTQKRKAELQRKLSMAPVKKPPSGLAERIKADIPEYLRPQSDRERFARSWAFTLRIAASIMLLVTSVFLTMQLISRDDRVAIQDPAEARKIEESPKARPSPLAGTPPPAVQTAASIQAPVEVAEQGQASNAGRVRNQAKDQTRSERASTEALRVAIAPPAVTQEAEVRDAADVASGLLGGVVADRVERDVAVTAEAPVVTSAPAAPPSAPAPAYAEAHADAAAPAAAATGAASKSSAAVVQFRRSAPPPVAEMQPFGISTDPAAVAKLNESIKRGDAPPKNVDVAAVVNHFAGAPADEVGAVRLQVEASQAPLKTDGTAIIRYTIDTPENLNAAVVSIVLVKGVIASHRTIGGVRAEMAGSLGAGQSATGLVELKVKPEIRPDQLVATVRLSYESPGTKQRVVVTSDVRAENLSQGWAMASRRHRLATLSAAWGESLTSEQLLDGLVDTAAQLAKEAPEDPLAKELAAVTASSRPRSSSPTGSGG